MKKNKGKNNIIPVFMLCAMLIISLMPNAAFAEEKTPFYIGNAINFADADDSLSSPYLTTQLDNITMEAWVKAGTLSAGDNYIRIMYNGNSGNSGYGIYIQNGVPLILVGGNGVGTVSGVTLKTSQWYHLAAVRNSGAWTFYVNGTPYTPNFGGGSSVPNAIAADNTFTVGNRADLSENFTGSIDEVRFWTAARTAQQINENRYIKLQGNEASLLAYYNFDQEGITPGGDNSGIKTVTDVAGGDNSLSLSGFTLTGNSSNFVQSVKLGSFALDNDTYNIIDGGNSVTIPIVRTDGSEGSATINYCTEDDTAKAGTHYTSTSGSVTFGEGETTKEVSIPILKASITESKTFNFEISGQSGISIGTPGSANVTIKPDLPTVNDNEIYANGIALIITGTDNDYSTIYIDANGNGRVDAGEKSLKEAGVADSPENGADLSEYTVYGGSHNSSNDSTQLAMVSGKVKEIYGGNKNGELAGDTYVRISGGTVTGIVSGGEASGTRSIYVSGDPKLAYIALSTFTDNKVIIDGSLTGADGDIKLSINNISVYDEPVLGTASTAAYADAAKFAFVTPQIGYHLASNTTTGKLYIAANTDTAYTVEHYVMDTEGNYPSVATQRDNLSGTSNASLTVSVLKDGDIEVTDGITYSHGKVDDVEVEETTVLPDGSRVIKLYYSRKQHTLTLIKGTGIVSVGKDSTEYYGRHIFTNATVALGYTWDKWTSSNATLLPGSNDKNYSFAMPAGKVTLTASATLNQYSVSCAPLQHGSITGSTTANYISAYSGTLKPDKGHALPDSITMTMGDLVFNDFTYDSSTGSITVAANKILGNLVVRGACTPMDYAVTYDSNGGSGTMTADTATYGVPFKLPTSTFTAPADQYFKEWAIGSTTGTKVAVGETYKFTAGTTVYALWEDLHRYNIINGAKGKWIMDSDTGIGFTSDGDYDKFQSVSVDGSIISSDNYTSQRGSTVVMLKAPYLKTLLVGRHTLQINFTDGYAQTYFTIKAGAASDNASTGDGSQPWLWSGIMLLAAAGIVAGYIIGRKRHNL